MAKATKKKPPADPIELAIADLDRSKATQCRAEVNDDVVVEYAELLRRDPATALPPIEVVIQGEIDAPAAIYIVDGWHRMLAHERAGFKTVWARVVAFGDIDAAVDFATRANVRHGLRRTNRDKRRAVEMAIALDRSRNAERSDREIAQALGVHHSTVGDIRAEMAGKAKPDKKNKRTEKGEPAAKNEADTPAEGEAPAPTKDGAGNDITDPRVGVAAAAIPVFDSLIAEGKALKSKIVDLARTDPGCLINESNIDNDIRGIISGLDFAKPYAACPYGANKLCDDTCKACNGRGWVNRAVWDRIPADIRRGFEPPPPDDPAEEPSAEAAATT